jgi:hypothetical protein
MSVDMGKRREACEGRPSRAAFICGHERAFREGCAAETNRDRPYRVGEPAARPRGEAP